MPTNTLTNPHDKFFRETFSRQEVAHDFVKYYLPPDVVNLLDLTTLDISKDSFIDPALEEHFSDLLYQVALNEGQPLYIYLLFDHKSYVDPLVSFQLLRYMVKIWELNLKQQQELRKTEPRGQKTALRLPPIFPLVVYHGLDTWKVSTEFRGLFDLPAALQPYIPNYSYWLADLSMVKDDELKGYIILQVAVLLLKYIQREELGQRLAEILGLLNILAHKQTALEYLETILRYVSSGTDKVTRKLLQEKVQELFEKGDNTIMRTIADTWIEEGREEGEKIGWQKAQAEAERRISEMEQRMRVEIEQMVKVSVQQILAEAEQKMKASEQKIKASEQKLKASERKVQAEANRKMRQVTLRNIKQTLAIRFSTPLEQYDRQLQKLNLATLERLNELVFTVTTLTEFEARLPRLKLE